MSDVGNYIESDMNATEREAFRLCIALEAIDDFVNLSLLDIIQSGVRGESTVLFKDRVHQQMFLVRLLDFSGERVSHSASGVAESCLDALREICSTRSFDVGNSVAGLTLAVTALRDWLDTSDSLTMRIPTLGIDAHLSVLRRDLVFILGNQAKHHLARLTGVSKRLATLLDVHGYAVPIERVQLALDDIREYLQENYFIFYGTWLTELINNVRWGIHDYLQPTLSFAFMRVPDDDVRYEYRYPPSIADGVGRDWFWRLMNHVRRRPYLTRFIGSRDFKRPWSMAKGTVPPDTPEQPAGLPGGTPG